jgi:YD repeat-containing protein
LNLIEVNGPVKTIREYKVIDKDWKYNWDEESKESDQHIYEFDQSGHLLKEEYSYYDMVRYRSLVWKDGRLIQILSEHRLASDNTLQYTVDTSIRYFDSYYCFTEVSTFEGESTTFFKVDFSGKIIYHHESSNSSRRNEESSYEYKYDDNNNLVEEIHKVKGEISSVERYSYDSMNHLVKKVREEFLGAWKGKTETTLYFYEGEFLISTEKTNFWGKKEFMSFEYDTSGNLVRRKSGDSVIEYFFDDNNRPVKVLDNDGIHYYEYEYNSFGLLQMKISIGEQESKKTLFFYDNHNNWVKKVIMEWDPESPPDAPEFLPWKTEYRDIEYWP